MALHESKILTNKTVELISKFQKGIIKPISTGIEHLDEVLYGGLTPGIIVGIVGRSQGGKSYDLERIQRHLLKNHEDVVLVNGNYELNFFKLLIRDIVERTGKSMDDILFKEPKGRDLELFKEICNSHRRDGIYYQNEPVSSEQFYKDVLEVIEKHPEKKIVVTVDNLENILETKGSQKSSMDDFLTKINLLKDMHPFICFIVLNQMNDNYILRKDNIKTQRPIESDIYGSGQLLKLCDVLYIKLLPWRLGIVDKFCIFGEDMYEWLDEFKIYSDSSPTASFDPIGVGYYFYLKRRNADIKDIKDVYAERIFSLKDTNFKIKSEVKESKQVQFEMPVFNTQSELPMFTPKDDIF